MEAQIGVGILLLVFFILSIIGIPTLLILKILGRCTYCGKKNICNCVAKY